MRHATHALGEWIRAFGLVAAMGAFFAASAPYLLAQPGGPPANQIRQLGMATLQYADSNNGFLPLAYAPNGSTGLQRFATILPVPADWRMMDQAQRIAESSVAWPNSLGSIMSRPRILETGGMREARVPGQDYVNVRRPFLRASLTFNGLLHNGSLAGITRPDRIPLLWQGMGNVNVAGFTVANPALNCDGTGPCRFNANTRPQANATSAWLWLWFSSLTVNGIPVIPSAPIRDHGQSIFTPDGSVDFWPIASDSNNVENVRDPFVAYASDFVPQTMRTCISSGSTIDYPCVFRPDAEFKP